MVLCFGLVVKTVLIIHQCFGCCWAKDVSSHAALPVKRLGMSKLLGEDTALVDAVLFAVSKHKYDCIIIPSEVVWFCIDLIIGRVFPFFFFFWHNVYILLKFLNIIKWIYSGFCFTLFCSVVKKKNLNCNTEISWYRLFFGILQA